MAFDAHSNFGYSLVAVAPVPANSGTQLQVAAGQGALFPAAPFNCTVWPAGVNPIASNAEIVRVTSVVGDVFTIVRAQEGTGAIAIGGGFQIANTTSNKIFTDIENAIPTSYVSHIFAGTQQASGGITFQDGNGITFGMDNGTLTASVSTGGGAALALSAGTESRSAGTIVFSNANNVAFGMDGAGVITAQAGIIVFAGTGFGTGAISFQDSNGVSFGISDGSNITARHNGLTSQSSQIASASNGSFAFQTLGFSNANGITFGTSGGSIISASHNGLTSQSGQAASASNGSFAFQTLLFTNAFNVTFGTSAGSIIFASVATAAAGNSINVSAGTQSSNVASLVFADSNGIQFGLNNGTITAAHTAALTSQSNQAFSASGGSSAFQTLNFANSNGITFSNSGGSIIASYTVPTQSTQPVAASASNGSFLFSTLNFSNANGVTFGTSAGSIITASVNTAAAGAGSLIYFEAAQPVSTGSIVMDRSGHLTPFVLPMSMSVSFARYMASMATSSTTLATLNSASATGNGSIALSFSAVAYSIGTGASSSILYSVTSGSGGWTFANSISVTNSSQYSVTQALSYLFAGVSSSLSTAYATTLSNYALSTTAFTAFAGVKWLDIPFANSLSAGNYWMDFHMDSTTGTAGAITGMSKGLVYPNSLFYINAPDFGGMNMGGASNGGAPFMLLGSFGTSATLASIESTFITGGGSNRKPYLQLFAQQ